MGTLSPPDFMLRSLMNALGPTYLRLFPNIFVLIRRELEGCRTVLDLGCGHHSPLQVCKIPFSVGVDMFEPSLLESRRRRIHSEYIRADVRNLGFKPRSFDAVIAVEVLEHLIKDEGLRLMQEMETWASKKVILTTPNGYLPQDPYDNNPLQEHRSGWEVEDLHRLGYKVYGSAGLKWLRGQKGQVKYRPAFLWERLSDMTQPAVYRCPKIAFQLLAVKTIETKS